MASFTAKLSSFSPCSRPPVLACVSKKEMSCKQNSNRRNQTGAALDKQQTGQQQHRDGTSREKMRILKSCTQFPAMHLPLRVHVLYALLLLGRPKAEPCMQSQRSAPVAQGCMLLRQLPPASKMRCLCQLLLMQGSRSRQQAPTIFEHQSLAESGRI